MTGKELVAALKKHRGKIQVQALFGDDVPWLFVQKSDVIGYFKIRGDHETGCVFKIEGDDAFISPES